MTTIKGRLMLLVGAGLAILAFSAPVAQADIQLQVQQTEVEMPCEPVALTGQKVTGGCLLPNVSGAFNAFAGEQSFGTYNIEFDIQVGEDGKFYAVNQDMGFSYFQRIPCRDKATGESIPWPGQIRIIPDPEFGEHQYEADFSLCATTTSGYSGETVNMTGTLTQTPKGNLSWAQTSSHPVVKNASWSSYVNYGVSLYGIEN